MEIEKKIWPEYYKRITSGKKKFELRLDDFEVNEGDILMLKEWDPKSQSYTGKEIRKKVAGVDKFKLDKLLLFWSKEEIEEKGIQIMSIE